MHYQRWYRHGDPMVRLPPAPGLRNLSHQKQAEMRQRGAATLERNREASGWWLRWLLQAVRRETA